jgi:hypothetical protein
VYESATFRPSGLEEAPGGEDDAWPWDRVSGRRKQQPERCDDRHLASVLGLAFETLKALISGHPAVVPKFTLLRNSNPSLQAE